MKESCDGKQIMWESWKKGGIFSKYDAGSWPLKATISQKLQETDSD